jgi:quercetin dioxygenase-like cupin family protein
MPFTHIEDLDILGPIPGFKGRFIHAENMTVANWEIQAGSIAPLHSHPHEQITMVIDGEFELTIMEETKILVPGIAAVVPPDAPHTGIALTDCTLIDIFHPVRDEYR